VQFSEILSDFYDASRVAISGGKLSRAKTFGAHQHILQSLKNAFVIRRSLNESVPKNALFLEISVSLLWVRDSASYPQPLLQTYSACLIFVEKEQK